MEKQPGPVSCVGQSLWDSQIVLARLMESQLWYQLVGFVGGGFRKGTVASDCLDTRHFSFSLFTIGAFEAATLVQELRGS